MGSFTKADANTYLGKIKLQKQIGTVIHELIHALGFSKDLLKYFVDEKLDLKGISNTLSSIEYTGIGVVDWYKGAKVIEYARKYFDCP